MTTQPERTVQGQKYIHTVVTSDGRVRTYLLGKPDGSDYLMRGETLLKTYELQTDGTLIEYVKPERRFATRRAFFLGDSEAQSDLAFNVPTTYYELMPNGDYRKISEEERQELEREAAQR